MTSPRFPRTGHPAVDRAHNALTDHLAELSHFWRSGGGHDALIKRVRHLQRMMEQHFREEIAILQHQSAPVTEHEIQHQQILDRMSLLLHRTEQQGNAHDCYELIEQIESDLFEHEVIVDGCAFCRDKCAEAVG